MLFLVTLKHFICIISVYFQFTYPVIGLFEIVYAKEEWNRQVETYLRGS